MFPAEVSFQCWQLLPNDWEMSNLIGNYEGRSRGGGGKAGIDFHMSVHLTQDGESSDVTTF